MTYMQKILALFTCIFCVSCVTENSREVKSLMAVGRLAQKRLDCMNEAEKTIDKWHLNKNEYEHFTQMAYLTCRSIYPIGEPEGR